MNNLVTIIMPSYNTENYIRDAIESVLFQSYTNWELIIVDDCSTDNTDDVVTPFLIDDRVRYIKSIKNSGAAESRNRALREAKGKWIAFLDSDDLWETDKLEKQIDFMIRNDYHFSYTNYVEMNEDSSLRGKYVTGPKRITRRGMYRYCWVGCLTVMYDAEYVGLIQVENIKRNNDYAMWLQISKKADCYLLDETLAKYRKRTSSISDCGYLKLVKWHYLLFRIAEKRSKLISVIMAMRNILFGIIKKIRYTI